MARTRAHETGESDGTTRSGRDMSPVVAVALVYLVMAVLVGAGWIAAAVPLR